MKRLLTAPGDWLERRGEATAIALGAATGGMLGMLVLLLVEVVKS